MTSGVMVSMDADLEPSGELELPTLSPFGHRVMHLVTENRPYCLVSEARGLLGYFPDADLAQPFLRILFFNAQHGRGRLDFCLWHWSEKDNGWSVCQRVLAMKDLQQRREAA